MSTLKIVDSDQLDNNLTAVAEAIRLKTGGISTLSFPNQFIEAINSIKGTTLENIATEEEMDAALIEDNIGKIYRYIGATSGNYTNGDLYIIEEV
jgi:hypothetical protein